MNKMIKLKSEKLIDWRKYGLVDGSGYVCVVATFAFATGAFGCLFLTGHVIVYGLVKW